MQIHTYEVAYHIVFDKTVHIPTPSIMIHTLEIYKVLSPENLSGEARGE